MASSPITVWQIKGNKVEVMTKFIFLGSKITVMVTKDMKVRKESYDKPRQHIKKQRHHFANKGPYGQSYGFSGSHVFTWELDYKEG